MNICDRIYEVVNFMQGGKIMNNRNSEDNKINYMLRRIYEMITLGIPLNEENLLFYIYLQ